MSEEVQAASKMPQPAGWRILCMVPSIDEKFDGTSLVRPDSVAKLDEHSTTVLFVLAVGPDAYKDKAKFPEGPWCKAGDFVIVRAYAGTRFKVEGKEHRLINDDQVEAVVLDPRGITRA